MGQGCVRFLEESGEASRRSALGCGTRMPERSQSCVDLGEYDVRRREVRMRSVRQKWAWCVWLVLSECGEPGRRWGQRRRPKLRVIQHFRYHLSVTYSVPAWWEAFYRRPCRVSFSHCTDEETELRSWPEIFQRTQRLPGDGARTQTLPSLALLPQIPCWGSLTHPRPGLLSSKNHPENRWILLYIFSLCLPSLSKECLLSKQTKVHLYSGSSLILNKLIPNTI